MSPSQTHSSSSPLQARRLVAAVGVFLLAVVAYHWVLPLDFTGLDSGPLIEANRFERSGGPLNCLTHEVRDSIEPQVAFYRPWTGLSYGLDHALFGLRARPYHGTDLLLHAAVAAALVLLLGALGVSTGASLVAGAWFAMHPVGVEVVPAVARRAELWMTLALVLACLGWRYRRQGIRGGGTLLVVAGVVAPLSKETAAVLPLLLWLVADGPDRRRAFLSGLLLIAPAVLLRTVVLGGLGGYGGWTLRLAPLRAGLGDLLDPSRLGGIWGVRIVFALLVLMLLYALARSRRRASPSRALRLGAGWLVFLLLPAALARGLSPWYLYAPALGMALLLGALLGQSRLSTGWRWAVGMSVVVVAMLPAWLVSPVVVSYPAWGEVSRQMRDWREVIEELPDEFFDGPQLVAGLPFRVDESWLPFGRVRSASCLSDFSLKAWIRLLRGRDSDPHAAALATILRPYPEWAVQVSWLPATGEVRLHAFGPVRLSLYRDDPLFRRLPSAGGPLRLKDLRAPLWRFDGRRLWRVPIPVDGDPTAP